MKTKKLINQIKPPCPKCPYTLGLVHVVKKPCPECKGNGYQTFERFMRQALGGHLDSQMRKRERMKNGK